MHYPHVAHAHPTSHAPYPSQARPYNYGPAAHPAVAGEHRSVKTGYDYPHTGTNGLVVGKHRSPWPHVGADPTTMDKFKTWLEQPTVASYPSIKNKHVAIVTSVAALAGIGWYGHTHHWF